MDSDVLEVLRDLGCFSAVAIDEAADSAADSVEQDPLDELWIDLGGEG